MIEKTIDDFLDRYGSNPPQERFPYLRDLLAIHTGMEMASQGQGDTELMRLLCLRLFAGKAMEDILRIWRAKMASMDADGAIEIQLLCGPGLSDTKDYLRSLGTDSSKAALDRLNRCEISGDFVNFVPEIYLRDCMRYFADDFDHHSQSSEDPMI